MARNVSFAAAAATVLALLGSAAAWPQGARNSSIPAENEANARQAAVDNAARPLLAAASPSRTWVATGASRSPLPR
ncbi:MAG: hypothetical protein IPM70_12965 [Proteobacteria bacterium]|nr:hypothetical protein [Pseudomonadota bacterium]